MHVDINSLRIHLNKEHKHRLLLAVKDVLVRNTYSVIDHFVFNKALIDVGELLVCSTSCGLGQSDSTVNTHAILSVINAYRLA